MQGSDAPRSRATVAHLRFRKQAAPCSSQTLHRNTALYLQENVQPCSKRTSPSLVGMQGSDAPRPRATVTHLRFCKQATSSSSKANQHALPSIETFNRAAKESRCLLRGCRGSDAPPPVPRRGERYGSAGAFLISWPRRAKVNSRIRRAASGQSGWPSSFSTASKGVRGAFMRIRRAPSERT